MIAFRQKKLSKDAIYKGMAYDQPKEKRQAYVSINPVNFEGVNYLEDEFVIEMVEYAYNPNDTEVATMGANVFEVAFYNSSSFAKVELKELETPIQLAVPIYENYNLTQFVYTYNELSPYRQKERIKRNSMLSKSLANCTFYNSSTEQWEESGCERSHIDASHIFCNCNHTTMYGFQFREYVEPTSSSSSGSDGTSSESSEDTDDDEITLDELLKDSLPEYFKSISEIMQHKPPSAGSFLMKPGIYIVLIFWFFYITSIFYYNGRDKKRRYNMTKQQNRDDLAELPDDELQQVDKVMRDMLMKGRIIKENLEDDVQTQKMIKEEKKQEKIAKYMGKGQKKMEEKMAKLKAKEKPVEYVPLPLIAEQLTEQ